MENINYDIAQLNSNNLIAYANPSAYIDLKSHLVNDEKTFTEFVIRLTISKKFNDINKPSINWSYDKTSDYLSNIVRALELSHNGGEHYDNSWRQMAEMMVTAAYLE
jgi:hypothetical protein